MLRLPPAFLLLFLSACASVRQTLAEEQKDFSMHFYAPFLEPGLGAQPPRSGDELSVASFRWTSDTTGHLDASLWQKKVAIDFATSADRKTISDLKVDLLNNGLAVWRHRHSYIQVQGQGYVWNTLEDVRPPLAQSLGASYDAELQAAVQLWARRKVEAILAGAPAVVAEADNGSLDRAMAMRYDKQGLVGTASGEFTIRLWGAPVRVAFTIKPHAPTHDNPWLIQLARPLELEYDRGEWRRRHGCPGGNWDADFPGPKPSDTAFMDDLLDRAAGYWSDAAVSIVMNGLDQQLKAQIGWNGILEDAPEPPPLAKGLKNLQDWPR